VVLAVLVVVAVGAAAGCGGVDIVKVSQSGTTIAVGIAGVPLQSGTCDPQAGTFAVSGTVNGLVIAATGTKVGENTMSGEWTIGGGPVFARAAYTAELVSRSFAANLLQYLK
jgi:hypothetical protein